MIEDEIATLGDASAALAIFRAAGVSDRLTLTGRGLGGAFCLANIETAPDGTFTFDEAGHAAVVIAIHDEHGEIADLIAWRSDQPGRWWRRLGMATFAGESAVREAAFFRHPLKVYVSPLSWLQSGCNGAVVLDTDADIRADFDNIPHIEAETLALGEAIERQLAERTAFRQPKIQVPIQEAA